MAREWTFFTNHAHVLIYLAAHPETVLREVAGAVGITESAVQRIVSDLEGGGYLTRIKVGRRNRYEIDPALPLRHALERDHSIGEVMSVFGVDGGAR